MYRPAKIEVRRSALFGYAATITRKDDGLRLDGSPQAYRGFDVEEGPFEALTHRRAFRKAFRAAGGRLWDIADEREMAECAS